MSARARLLLYLVFLHLVFAATAIVFLWNHRVWLLAVELFFVASFAVALRIVRQLFEPIELLRSGVQQLRDSDFMTRFRPSGQVDLDALVAVYNQMSDRLRDERTHQQEQELFLDRILAASPAGVLVFDFENAIASANPAARRMLEIQPVAAPPAAHGDRLVGRTLDELGTSFARALAAIPDGESRVVPLQGGRRFKCQRAQFLDRGFGRSFLVLEELTEELRRSEKAAYEKLVRMMSHEVNNTTAAVGSLLSACAAYREQVREADRGDFTTALEVAIARTRRLSAFTNDFADVVRLAAPRREPLDVVPLVTGVVALLRGEAAKRRVQWAWQMEENLPPVSADPVQMEQVLLNVLKNALESIGTDGVVTLGARREDTGVVLRIRDTGGGLAPGAREHLFTPFFTTKESGQGLGLTLSREILAGHGFEFELANATDGGAEFVVWMRA